MLKSRLSVSKENLMSNHIPTDFKKNKLGIDKSLLKSKSNDLKPRLDNNILFDGDDNLFKSLISEVKTYFEYGCVKSTEYMYKNSNASIFSVDTSKEWAVKTLNLSKYSNNDRLNVKWIDVGDVADWGYPTSFKKKQNFVKYANWFWSFRLKPDLVVIDGRFRVLCFLTSVMYAPVGTKIIFDDYTNRPFYHVVEEFLKIKDTCGRQALFEVNERSKKLIDKSVISEFKNIVG